MLINNKVSLDYCSGKCRASQYFGQTRKMTARMSRITYDKENNVLLIRDEIKTLKENAKELFTTLPDYFGAIPELKEGIQNYYFLGSLYFYLDIKTFKISSIYVDSTDNFYSLDDDTIFNDEEYASWKEEFTKIIINDLKNKYQLRKKELLKEMK